MATAAEMAPPAGEGDAAQQDDAKPTAMLDAMQDSSALERGISNLDKLMAHLRQKVEDRERQIEADSEELVWVEKEIEHSRPKLKALEDELKEKLKEREILAEEIQSSVDRIQAMMKNSSELVRNAMRKDRALQKADASYKLSVARGFDTKTSTRDLVNTKAKRAAK